MNSFTFSFVQHHNVAEEERLREGLHEEHQLKGIKVTRRGGHRVDLGQEEEEAEAEREVEEGEKGGGLGEHEDDAQQADWGGGQFEEEG